MAFDVSFIYRIVDKYSSKLRSISANTSSFAGRMSGINGKVAASFGKINGAVGMVGRGVKRVSGIALGAMAAVGAALIKPVEHARALEAAISDVDKVFSFENAGARDAFIKNITGLATTLGRTRTEVANLAFEAGKLGIAEGDIAKFVELSAKASTALDGLPIEESGQIIGNLANKFKLTTDEVQGMLGAVNLLADGTTTNGGEILKVVGRMSGQFASLAIPPEVSAGLSAFARQFAETDELAASGMKMFLRELDQVKLSQAPVETITKTLQSLSQMELGTRIATIEDIFGKEASTFVQGLVANVDSLGSTMAIVADKTKNAASLQAEFNRKMGTADQRITNAKNRLIDVSATVGNAFLPAIAVIADKFIEMAPRIEAFFTNNQDKFTALAQAFVDAGPIIEKVFGVIIRNGERLFGLIGKIIDGIKYVSELPGVKQVLGLVGDLGSMAGNAVDSFLGIDRSKPEGGKSLVGTPANSNLAVNAKTQGQAVSLNGRIGVDVTGPGKVREARVKSDAPGDLGMNVGMAGAM